MDVTKLPFNELIGLQLSSDPDFLMMLNDNQSYHNHLGTVHASAEFALAEATSGLFLFSEFEGISGIIPVVRRVEIKYKKPAKGKLYSKARFADNTKEEIFKSLSEKTRVGIAVDVFLFDENRIQVMTSTFEWVVIKEV